jgi:hypothetical protein
MTKAEKSDVQYGKGMPKAHCSICFWYMDKPSAPIALCVKVKGMVRAQMWCSLFKALK